MIVGLYDISINDIDMVGCSRVELLFDGYQPSVLTVGRTSHITTKVAKILVVTGTLRVSFEMISVRPAY
jgi:hypothetical protein